MSDDIRIPLAQSVLIDLDLDKISLCEQGANSRAHILLTKRKENNAMPKTFEELLAAMGPESADVIKNHIAAIETKHTDAISKLEKEVEDLNKSVKTLEGENEDLKKSAKPDGAKTDSVEAILKKASPEVAAYIETLQKSVDSLVADRAEAVAKARFEAVKAIPVEEESLKEVLKSASPAVFEVLKAAAKAVEDSVLTQKGKDTGNDTFQLDSDAAYTSLEKSAKSIMKDKPELTYEQAFTEACTNDPVTYAKYAKGVK